MKYTPVGTLVFTTRERRMLANEHEHTNDKQELSAVLTI